MKAVIALAFVATALAQEFVGCFDSSAVTSSGYSQQTSASAKASNEGCQVRRRTMFTLSSPVWKLVSLTVSL
jgi:hypothetical protein